MGECVWWGRGVEAAILELLYLLYSSKNRACQGNRASAST